MLISGKILKNPYNLWLWQLIDDDDDNLWLLQVIARRPCLPNFPQIVLQTHSTPIPREIAFRTISTQNVNTKYKHKCYLKISTHNLNTKLNTKDKYNTGTLLMKKIKTDKSIPHKCFRAKWANSPKNKGILYNCFIFYFIFHSTLNRITFILLSKNEISH